jgi:hypothetical protein
VTTVWTPNLRRRLAEEAASDFGKLAYDGFGIMLSDDQLEAHDAHRGFGPRVHPDDPKFVWYSGGQRGGKTVQLALGHLDCGLYKRGLDFTDRRYWANFQYGTLAIAPTTDLTLRLWQIVDEIAKGTSPSQYDRRARRSRGGAFLGKIAAGKAGQWPIVRFDNGSVIDFRSSEGRAYRLEGGSWWMISWDEWASQPDREIKTVKVDVLMGRARDHDAKVFPMAWPKPETEHHLIAVERSIEKAAVQNEVVVYLSSRNAPWTNRDALRIELAQKDEATIKRTIDGRTAGGAGVEYKHWMVSNLVRPELPKFAPREEGYGYFVSWDLGLAHDATVGFVWRIPIVGGRHLVSPQYKARIVNRVALVSGPNASPEQISSAVSAQQALYQAQSGIDASGLGGIMAVRGLSHLNPKPYGFVARSNDRLHGNMRLAAITNALDLLSWGRPDFDDIAEGEDPLDLPDDFPWGVLEMPAYQETIDQLLLFDRDAKEQADDEVAAFNIGAWYIRRWWVQGIPGARAARSFDPRRRRKPNIRANGSVLLPGGPDRGLKSPPDAGIRFIRPVPRR